MFPDNLDQIMQRVFAFNDRLRAADAFVSTRGLVPTTEARAFPS